MRTKTNVQLVDLKAADNREQEDTDKGLALEDGHQLSAWLWAEDVSAEPSSAVQ